LLKHKVYCSTEFSQESIGTINLCNRQIKQMSISSETILNTITITHNSRCVMMYNMLKFDNQYSCNSIYQGE